MAEAVVLGELELDLVTGILMDESRRVVVHPWPGATGDLVQDLGPGAVRIWLSGVAAGDGSGDRLEALRQAMQDGQPLDFTASVAVASAVERILVTGLRVVQPPGRVSYYEYQLSLVQYVEPPPAALAAGFSPDALAQIEQESSLAALGDVTGAVEGVSELQQMAEEGASMLDQAAAMVEQVVELVKGLAFLEPLIRATGDLIGAAK